MCATCARLNPAPQQIVLPGSAAESPAPCMISQQGRLLNDQTSIRTVVVNTVCSTKSFMIGLEIKSKQRQLKSAAALKGAVAFCRVAAEPSQQRYDMFLKIRYRRCIAFCKAR